MSIDEIEQAIKEHFKDLDVKPHCIKAESAAEICDVAVSVFHHLVETAPDGFPVVDFGGGVKRIYLATFPSWVVRHQNLFDRAPKYTPTPPPAERRTNIYFMQAVEGGFVKIGAAVDVTARLKQHQSSSPVILRIVKTISNVPPRAEKDLHRNFHPYRKHGEWFSPEVLELPIDIEELCQ